MDVKIGKKKLRNIICILYRAETGQRPWRASSREIQEGNKWIEWKDRVLYAYWRGNPPQRLSLEARTPQM